MNAKLANIINFADKSVNILIKAPRQTPGRGEFLHMVSEGFSSLHAKRKLKSNHQDMLHLNSRKEGFDIIEETLPPTCFIFVRLLYRYPGAVLTNSHKTKPCPWKENAFNWVTLHTKPRIYLFEPNSFYLINLQPYQGISPNIYALKFKTPILHGFFF